MSAAIQGIYIALFGRPADPGGLAYWTEVTKGGADLSAMLSVLPNLTEYTTRFEGQTPDQVITTVYQNLFGRAPDAEGLAFFKGQLASGAQTLATIAVNIMQGAQGDDKADVDAKVGAAELFTASLDTQAEIDAYKGADAAALAKKFLDTVDKDKPATPESVEKAAGAVVAGQDPTGGQAPNPGGGGTGGGGGGPQPAIASVDRTINSFDSADLSGWAKDRYDPAGFSVVDGALFHSISEAAGKLDRPAGFQTDFYNTQGKKLDLKDGTQKVSVDLYIDPAWKTVEGRHAGLWATGADKSGAISTYPIVEFQTVAGVGEFRGWEFSGDWKSGATPPNFQFGKTYTLSLTRNPDGSVRYDVAEKGAPGNAISFSTAASSTIDLDNVILQGHNTTDGRSYLIKWDNLTQERSVLSGDYTGNSTLSSKYDVVTVDGAATLTGAQTSGLKFVGDGTLTVKAASTVDFSASAIKLVVEGTSGADTLTGGNKNDVFNGGAGADVIKGGLGTNTVISSAGGDRYTATTGEEINFKFGSVAHSQFGGDVTTFDFAGVTAPVKLNILIGGADFASVAGAITAKPSIAAGGFGRDSSAEVPAGEFFWKQDGDTARPTPGQAGAVDQSLVIYKLVNAATATYDVYFDADADGKLSDADAVVRVIGIGNADISFGSAVN
jgi:hypothetical protein